MAPVPLERKVMPPSPYGFYSRPHCRAITPPVYRFMANAYYNFLDLRGKD